MSKLKAKARKLPALRAPKARRGAAAIKSAAAKMNRIVARRRSDAWRKWDEQQEGELSAAMAALAGCGHSPITATSPRSSRQLAASYDAAVPSDGNMRHWANADSLGAMAANSPSVRATLRRRARYEVANNCTARGILMTYSHDLVGKCPRVQFDTSVAEANSLLEEGFAKWAAAAKLGAKLRTAAVAKKQDGEVFALFTTNKKLRHPVKLDIRLVEADQIADPVMQPPTPNHVDGIVFDDEGNPVEYHMRKVHPGEPNLAPKADEVLTIPADQMVHWFRADRPGQVRGVPEITPALPLMAQGRRFILATLDAAEAAADFAVLLYTEMPPYTLEDGQYVATPVIPMTSFDMERRMMTAVPAGWKAAQMKAEHPATTFKMFKAEIVNDFGRCICMPYGVAAGNSSDYNFASGRLDLLPYRKSLEIEEGELEDDLMARMMDNWLDEALKYYGIRYPIIATLDRERISHHWVWGTIGYGVNPVDEANARRVDLECGLTSRQTEYEKKSLDWDTEDERAATSFGMTVEEYRRKLGEAILAGKGQAPVSDANNQDERQQDLKRQKKQADDQAAETNRSKKA